MSLAPPTPAQLLASIDDTDCTMTCLDGHAGTALANGVPLYTLDGARQEIARQECDRSGHDHDYVETTAGRLVSITCRRACGHPGWDIHDRSQPDPYATLISGMLADLWSDLAAAYRTSTARPRETSIACHGLIKRIQDVSRHTVPAPPGTVEPLILVTGLYEVVHAGAGIDVRVPEHLMDRARAAVDVTIPTGLA